MLVFIALSNSRYRGAYILLSIHLYSHRELQIIKNVLRFNLRGCNVSKFSGAHAMHACVSFAHNESMFPIHLLGIPRASNFLWAMPADPLNGMLCMPVVYLAYISLLTVPRFKIPIHRWILMASNNYIH